VKFNDSFHKSESHACSFYFRAQLIEKTEDPFMIFRRNADAVVFDIENRFAMLRVFAAGKDFGF
jgi:replication-associated recombination protein RarA